ncbi:MAG TPA: hypothetical protein VH877_31115 [Polyangia bacterium]|jgi:4-amino-4-deoxy-L-arabinose transferase-like glycosyltransferase|nr:hypothetical protein [Polyangia bacterium]
MGRDTLHPGIWVIGGAGLAVAAGALFSTPPRLEELDAVNFALALDDFDLSRYQPHFPGYPVYVALARTATWVAPDAPRALAGPGALMMVIAGLATWRALAGLAGSLAAFAGSLLLILCPRLVVEATKPTSDALGAAWLVVALASLLVALNAPAGSPAQRRELVLAGAALGLLLGIRLSYMPFVLSLGLVLAAIRARPRVVLMAAAGLGAGVLAWAGPLLWVVGPRPLWRLASEFLVGHFSRWGGTAWTQPTGRFELLARGLGPLGMGTLGAGWGGPTRMLLTVLLLFGLGGLAWELYEQHRAPAARRAALLTSTLVLPYLAWVLLAQNLARPRHLLPLALIFAALTGVGLARLAQRLPSRRVRIGVAVVLIGAACMASLAVTWPALQARRERPSAAFQVVSLLAPRTARVLFFGGEAVRLATYYAPPLRARRPGDIDGVRSELGALIAVGAPVASAVRSGALEIYLTSDIDGIDTVLPALTQVAELQSDAWVEPHDARLVLYRVRDLDRLLGRRG